MANSLLVPGLWTQEIMAAYKRSCLFHTTLERVNEILHDGAWFEEQAKLAARRGTILAAILLGGLYLAGLLVWAIT